MKENMKLLFYKPWKLILSIFLSALVVASVAISSVIYTTNSKEKAFEQLYGYVQNHNNYLGAYGSFNEENREQLKKELNLSTLPIYKSFHLNKPFLIVNERQNFLNDYDYRYKHFYQSTSFSYVDETLDLVNNIHFAYGNRFPDKGEIAINDLQLELFKQFGYTSIDKVEQIEGSKIAENPNILIGKTIRLYNSVPDYYEESIIVDYKICSIINTGFFEKNVDSNNFINQLGQYYIYFLNKDDIKYFIDAYNNNKYMYPDKVNINMLCTKIKSKDQFKNLLNILNSKNFICRDLVFKKSIIYAEHFVDNQGKDYYKDNLGNIYDNIDSIGTGRINSYSISAYNKEFFYIENSSNSSLNGFCDYEKLPTIAITLLSIIIIPLILYLANIMPYIRDEIWNNPDYFKKQISNKKNTKFFSIQYLVLTGLIFVLSLVFSFLLSLLVNSLVIDFYSAEIEHLSVSILFPISINYICVLICLGLSLILSLFGFIFIKNNLKDINQ